MPPTQAMRRPGQGAWSFTSLAAKTTPDASWSSLGAILANRSMTRCASVKAGAPCSIKDNSRVDNRVAACFLRIGNALLAQQSGQSPIEVDYFLVEQSADPSFPVQKPQFSFSASKFVVCGMAYHRHDLAVKHDCRNHLPWQSQRYLPQVFSLGGMAAF